MGIQLGDIAVVGGFGSDILPASSRATILSEERGHDVLTGGAGKDILWGGAGSDTLNGGAGDGLAISGLSRREKFDLGSITRLGTPVCIY